MPVRTSRLTSGSSGAANANVVIYTAPAGHTAIVKDVRLSRVGSAIMGVNIGVESGPARVWLFSGVVPAETVTIGVACWVVLEPSDRIVLNVQQSPGFNYYVSGTELAGVAP